MFSTIITTYGMKGISLVDNLLNSISSKNNPSLDEIIISEDGSTYDTVMTLTKLKEKYSQLNIKIKCNQYNKSYSKTVNSGILITNPDNDILILNNDMIALTSFEPFVNFIEENNRRDKIGIIGGKLLSSNMRIHHTGFVRYTFTHIFGHAYRYKHQDYFLTNFPEKYVAVSGACQYINRQLIDKIGYYDERYRLSHEDVDYCLTSQLNGYETWYIPDVILIHYESLTRKFEYDKYNHKIFWEKWINLYPIIDPSIQTEESVKFVSGTLGALYLISKFL